LSSNKFEGHLWIITGEIGAGKTVLCTSLIKAFEDLGWQISGLRSPAIFENGEKTGIAVENLATGEIRKLAVSDYKPEDLEGEPLHWTFDVQVLAWGNQVFLDSIPTELLVVDEIGPLELIRGEGWINAIKALDSKQYNLALLTMRPKLLEKALSLWPWGEVIKVESVDQVKEILERLMEKFIE
jgi:nucleoside-triphosphatase THEP1